MNKLMSDSRGFEVLTASLVRLSSSPARSYRSWSDEEKGRIVGETVVAGANVGAPPPVPTEVTASECAVIALDARKPDEDEDYRIPKNKWAPVHQRHRGALCLRFSEECLAQTNNVMEFVHAWPLRFRPPGYSQNVGYRRRNNG